LEESIDSLHGQLARIDWDISTWAKKNLNKIKIDSIEIDPADAAKELVSNVGSFEWITDQIGISENYEPKFNDQDIRELRSARSDLGQDLVYLEASLPQLVEFPESKSILLAHQDLSRFEQLKKEIYQGGVPSLVDTSQDSIDSAIALKASIDELKAVRSTLLETGYAWIGSVKNHLKDQTKKDVQDLLNGLGKELNECREKRKNFLSKPVVLPTDFEINSELVDAVTNLSEGKKPFGMSGLIGKAAEKKILASIQVLAATASSESDWKHVKAYVLLQKQLRELVVRWNALANELLLPVLNVSPMAGIEAINLYEIYENLKKEIALEEQILREAKKIFTTWNSVENILSDQKVFDELDRALRHHLTKNRLANVWSQKEQFQKLLDVQIGPVID
jgi:hypothetical protein